MRITQLLGILALLSLATFTMAQFEEPNETIHYYLDGISQNNVDKVLEATAIDEMGNLFNFTLSSENRGGIFLNTTLAPTDYAFYSQLNQIEIAARITKQVRNLTFGLLANLEDVETPIFDIAMVQSFSKLVNPERLTNIEVLQITHPDILLLHNDKFLENRLKLALIDGAEEITERVVLFSFEDNTYYIGFTLLKYGDFWKVSSQSSPIAATPSNGMALRITREEFEKLFTQN